MNVLNMSIEEDNDIQTDGINPEFTPKESNERSIVVDTVCIIKDSKKIMMML